MSAAQNKESGGNGGDGGNTRTISKRVNPGKKWCFTYNNYPTGGVEALEECFGSTHARNLKSWIFGEEVGESGTRHLQGFLFFNKNVRPLSFFKEEWAKKSHWEKCKGSMLDNVKYCSKDGKVHKSADIVIPKATVLMTRDLLTEPQKALCDLFLKDEDPLFGRTIFWRWEAVGNWGKTKTAMYMVDQMGAIYVSGKAADAKSGIAAYVEKNGQAPRLVVIDVPRTKGSKYISYEAIESIKNGVFFNTKYESGMLRFNRPHVLVFANEPPCDLNRLSADRWDIQNLRGKKRVHPIFNAEPQNKRARRDVV
jgi:hypothetical protein